MTEERGVEGNPDTVNIVSGNVFGSVVMSRSISGGVHIHTGEPPVVPVVTSVVARESAPEELFVGRAAEVEELLAAVEPDGGGRAVVVSAGMGGVGKTALARHVAAIAVQRRWFAGAAILVDLRGYDPDGRVVASEDVFAPLLRMLGVAAGEVPEMRAEQAAVYHRTLDRLARQGERVLLVLDNASSGDQVRNLLPRQSAHRVLVTTRDRLSVQGGRTLVLEEPPLGEARMLLDQALREQLPDDTRVGDNPEMADRLVRSCGALPLAVRIVAAILADEPDLPLTALVEELRHGGELSHGELSVDGAFDASWRRLLARDPSAARLGWLCTLSPGPDLDTEAARALDGRAETEVRAGLRTLRQAHLLGRADGRWQLHDLVRRRLAQQRPAGGAPSGAAGEAEAALVRLLEHYLQAVRDRDAEWFGRERACLLTSVPVASAAGRDRLAADLAAAVCEFLTEPFDLPARLLLCLHEVDAAERFADVRRRAEALERLGVSLAGAARFHEALTVLRESLKLWRTVGDEERVADALWALGRALTRAKRPGQAVPVFRESAEHFRALRAPLREAAVMDDLALALSNLRKPDEALAAARRSSELFAAAGKRESELHLRVTAAAMHVTAGRYHEAVSEAETVARLAKDEGYLEAEARACSQLAVIYGQTGRQRRSNAYRERALTLCRQSEDESLEAEIMLPMSVAVTAMADVVDAAAAVQHEVDYHRSVGNRNGEGDALHRLGLLLSDRAQLSAAYQVHGKAVEVWRESGNRYREGVELATLAKAYAAVDRRAAARRTVDEAVEALTDSGSVDEAEALRAWADELPDASADEPEELLGVTSVTTERRSGCVQLLTIVGVVVAAVVGAPWWVLAGWSLLLGGLRTARALVTGRRGKDGAGEPAREPMLDGTLSKVEGCLTVLFAAGLGIAYVVGGPWWLLAACTVLAGCWVSGKQGVVVFTLIGILVLHFAPGTWWVAAGLAAPLLGYRNTMGPAFTEATRRVEVG